MRYYVLLFRARNVTSFRVGKHRCYVADSESMPSNCPSSGVFPAAAAAAAERGSEYDFSCVSEQRREQRSNRSASVGAATPADLCVRISDNSELLSRLTQLAENLNRTDQASETFKPKLWVDGQSFLYPFVIVPYFFHSFFLAFLFFPLSPFSVH